MTDTTWAAKVLENVPRHSDSQGYEPEYILEADALAAIARMGAEDEELQFPDGWRERAHSFKGILKLQAAWADGFNATRDLAAAHIAALTAQNREMALDVLASSGQAQDAYAAQLAAEAERDALRERVARLEGALHNCVGMLDQLVAESGRGIEWDQEDPFRMGEWFEPDDIKQLAQARAALTDGGKDG